MARKTIEVFSISFLDLLSGALGAVILLYVIVPRMTITTEEFQEQKKLKEEVDKLGLKIEELRTAIPKDLFERLQQRIQDITETNAQLNAKAEETKTSFNKCVEEQSEALNKIENLTESIRQVKQDMGQCEEDMEQLKSNIKYLLVTIYWDTEQDVDMLIKMPDGKFFISGSDSEITTLDNRWGPGLELWKTNSLQAGTYQVYVNLFSRNGGRDYDNDGTDDETSPVIDNNNPNVRVRIYFRNGFKEFTKTLTTPTFVDRRNTSGDVLESSLRTAVLITTINVDNGGTIMFN